MYLLGQILGNLILVVPNLVHLMREVFTHIVYALELVNDRTMQRGVHG